MDYTMGVNLDILSMGIYISDNSMVNTLTLKEMENYFLVTVYTKKDHTILVHYIKDNYYRFKECRKGLYYLDVSNP